MKHEQTAWIVLTPKDWDDPDELRPYGNGAQFQYPIFHTRKEAKSWRSESPWDRGRIIPGTISFEYRQRKQERAAKLKRVK